MPEFERCRKVCDLTENDIIDLEVYLCANPQSGSIMVGTGGLRKFRLALPNRGKNYSVRVVYVDFASYEKIYLISA